MGVATRVIPDSESGASLGSFTYYQGSLRGLTGPASVSIMSKHIIHLQVYIIASYREKNESQRTGSLIRIIPGPFQLIFWSLCIAGDRLRTSLWIAENVSCSFSLRSRGTIPIPLIFQVESYPCQTEQYWYFRQRSYRRSKGLFRIDTINGYSYRDGEFL